MLHGVLLSKLTIVENSVEDLQRAVLMIKISMEVGHTGSKVIPLRFLSPFKVHFETSADFPWKSRSAQIRVRVYAVPTVPAEEPKTSFSIFFLFGLNSSSPEFN
jgi:hypothetical protein